MSSLCGGPNITAKDQYTSNNLQNRPVPPEMET